jgi:hypothetical protein
VTVLAEDGEELLCQVFGLLFRYPVAAAVEYTSADIRGDRAYSSQHGLFSRG